MKDATRIALAVLSTLVFSGSLDDLPGAGPAESDSVEVAPMATAPAIVVIDAMSAEEEMVEWAQSRFAAADLSLPDLTITFHVTLEGCGGFNGLYTQATHSVQICNRGGLRTDARNTVLHELGHAWAFEYLSEERTAAFTALRDIESWSDEGVAWLQRGQEQTAEIIAWGLMDEDPFQSLWTRSEACRELVEAFRTLTAQAPLHSDTGFCRTS